MKSYTLSELEDIQVQWDIHFPPDLLNCYNSAAPCMAGQHLSIG